MITTHAGSGKTFTMIGNETAGPGVMVLAMQDLFQKIESLKSEREFRVKMSYIEIYNEQVHDLFLDNSADLPIREDPVLGITVAGIS